VGALLVAGYLFWLRDSSLVQVRTVNVTGLSGTDSARIRAALGATARSMTTLHVDRRKLERAASVSPLVRGIQVRPAFPHGIRIHVLERRPAALLVARSGRVPIAGDGTVLSGLAVKGRLPLIQFPGSIPAGRVPEGAQLAAVKVAGAAPAVFRARVAEVGREPGKGVVVQLEGGPKLIFGDGSRVGAKWAAAAGVMADPDAAGADYVDVRIPERPAAGGLPVETVAPVAPAGAPAAGAAAPAPTAPGAAPLAAPPVPAVDPSTAPGGDAPATPAPTPALPPAAGGGAAAPNPQP